MAVQNIIETLELKYKRKRALIEELGKIKKEAYKLIKWGEVYEIYSERIFKAYSK